MFSYAKNRLFFPLPMLTLLLFTATGAVCAPLPAVTYAVVETRPAAVSQTYTGRVEALNHVDVLTRTEGFIQKINFTDGQQVNEGDILFEIDPAVHLSSVEQAEARVKSAEATLALAEVMNERLQGLARTRAVSQADADRAFADLGVARAALMEAEAGLHAEQLKLGFTKITAPITGRMGTARVSRGSFVKTGGSGLADVVQLEPVRVVLGLQYKDYMAAMKGDAPEKKDFTGQAFAPRLRFADGSYFAERGTFESVGNVVDTRTDTVEVRILFSNADKMLLPGAAVDVVLEAETPETLPAIPVIALQQDRDSYFVLVLDNEDAVAVRPVVPGPQTGQYFLIREGLSPGERVIVDGIQKIRVGMKVQPVPRNGQ